MKLTSLLKSTTTVAALLSLGAGAAFAQVIPGGADPVRSFLPQNDSITPRDTSTTSAPVVSAPIQSNVTAAAAQQVFVLGNVSIEGMTVYYPEDFKVLYAHMIGQRVSVADVQRLADRITQQYRTDGYVLASVGVPQQKVGPNGVISIRVNEGHITNIVYEGQEPKENLRNLARTYANKIKENNPLKADVMERYLLLINDLPGNTARAFLRPSTTEVGGTDIIISYNHKYVEGMATIENRGSRYLGPWQGSVTVGANSALGMDERTVARFLTTAPTSEMRYYELQHEQQLGSEGTRLQLNASHVDSRPGDFLRPLEVKGNTDDFRAFVYHPVIRSRLQNLTVRGGLDVMNNSTDILGSKFSEDHIRSVRVGAQYDIADSAGGVNQMDLQVSQGIDGLGATNDGAGRTRTVGKQSYTKVNAELARTQSLPSKFSLYTAATGQYANDPLLTAEQFTLGGARFGSAYDPGELSGDHGIAGRAELRYGDSVGQQYLDAYQVYGFFDAGKVWLKDALASEKKTQSLTSTGVGARANFTPVISGSLEVAKPLSKDVAAEGDKDTRIFTNLTARF